jgi:hypothetical protein
MDIDNIHQATVASTVATDDPDSGSNDLTEDSPGTPPPQASIHSMSRLYRQENINAAFQEADVVGPAPAPSSFHQSVGSDVAAMYVAEQYFPNPLLVPRQIPLNSFQVANAMEAEGKIQTPTSSDRQHQCRH